MIQSVLLTGLLFFVPITACTAEQQRAIHCRVTYCTTAQIYFDGGKEEGLSIGDTLTIARGDTSVGSAVITGVSSHSSVGRALISHLTTRIGDTGTFMKEGTMPPIPAAVGDSTTVALAASPPSSPGIGRTPSENVLTGRVAFQYTGQIAEDSRLNISQPALYAHVRLENLAGSGMSLSLYGREYYDIGGPYLRYGDSAHSRLDVSELSLGFDRQTAAVGFSAGRFISRYVTGIGVLDGGEVFLRQGVNHSTPG